MATEKTVTIVQCVRAKRLSRDGNPYYDVQMSDGTHASTKRDAAVNYTIDNSEWHGRPVVVQFDQRGEVVGVRDV